MKRPKKKHLKRCNGKLELIERTYTSGVYKCNKCNFKTTSYKRRLNA